MEVYRPEYDYDQAAQERLRRDLGAVALKGYSTPRWRRWLNRYLVTPLRNGPRAVRRIGSIFNRSH